MKLSRLAVPLIAAGILLTAGCSHQTYYVSAPPPPPVNEVPPMIAHARHEGYRAGQDDAARDLYNRSGYHPRNNWKYRDTPGFQPGMGPFADYQNTFRLAYLSGYEAAFRQQ
ncbi:hypothetical protein [Edaphobacter sp.]|uniref:hypothetical protein n=1 Tax=Edaphobacter sp. TaxID=1934404 RepID=UPI002DB840DE|nr:hypothetical protein [Edaphobacter sp.]HEU5341241.1 hypothetical protein [Edaphobacter sp.]